MVNLYLARTHTRCVFVSVVVVVVVRSCKLQDRVLSFAVQKESAPCNPLKKNRFFSRLTSSVRESRTHCSSATANAATGALACVCVHARFLTFYFYFFAPFTGHGTISISCAVAFSFGSDGPTLVVHNFQSIVYPFVVSSALVSAHRSQRILQQTSQTNVRARQRRTICVFNTNANRISIFFKSISIAAKVSTRIIRSLGFSFGKSKIKCGCVVVQEKCVAKVTLATNIIIIL